MGKPAGPFEEQEPEDADHRQPHCATALLHGLTIATRNTEDFRQCQRAAFNPFEIS
jgi:hypothetical protein